MSYVVIFERVTDPSYVVGPFDSLVAAEAYGGKYRDGLEVWRVLEFKSPVVEAVEE